MLILTPNSLTLSKLTKRAIRTQFNFANSCCGLHSLTELYLLRKTRDIDLQDV